MLAAKSRGSILYFILIDSINPTAVALLNSVKFAQTPHQHECY